MSEQDDLDRYRYLQLKQKMAIAQGNVTPPPPPSQSLGDQATGIVKQAANAALESSPANLTKRLFQTDPATMQRVGGGAFPVVGGAIAGPIGAAGGELLRQATGAALAHDTVPQTGLGRAASVITAGVTEEPKMLSVIPGVSQAAEAASNLASKSVAGAAKIGEALTGTKAKDTLQAFKQGYKTYAAPSMEEAQNIFGKAMESAGISSKPPLRQIIDPQLSTARKVALDVGDKLEKGLDIGAGDALRGRQAIDRIYNATPFVDRATRANLADLRTAFDDVIAGKSGALKEASTLYRQAIVKSNLLNPFRVTKQGQMSAVAPMIATLAASAGIGSGHKEGSTLGGLGYLAASSPALLGLGATSAGQAAQVFNSMASNPAIRQILAQLLQTIIRNKQSQANQPKGNQ